MARPDATSGWTLDDHDFPPVPEQDVVVLPDPETVVEPEPDPVGIPLVEVVGTAEITPQESAPSGDTE